MKKILSLTLCILLFASAIFPASAEVVVQEENYYRDGDYLFEIIEGSEISITYYTGTQSTPIIPSSIGGLPVTHIGERAFFGNDIKEVTIPDGVTHIAEEAFYNCQSLESVTLPKSLESMGTAIFRFCQNLKTVTFSGADTSPILGKYTFYACNSLESVNIPEGVTNIPEGMFAFCESLENITLPQNTESVYDYAFYGSGLRSITLPESLDYIGDMAFAECSSLSDVYFGGTIKQWNAVEFGVNNGYLGSATIHCRETSDGYKYSISNGEVTITGYTGESTVVNIPETIDNCPVTKVSSYAFIDNTDITVVVYPKGVTAVESISFANCKSLQSVHLPDTVTTIGGSAFFGCTKLVNISIPKNVEVIGNSAFQKCEGLTNITLPDSVKSVGGLAFAECTKLESVKITGEINTIEESTFEKCTSLKTIEIPASVTSIHTRAFYYCSSLSDVYFGGTIKQWNAVEIGVNNGYLGSATIHCQETSEEMFNIFFSNNRNWNSVYIYGYYGSDINNPTAEPLGAYPGTKMTFVEKDSYGQDIYSAEVPADIDYIEFTDGSAANNRTNNIPKTEIADNAGFYLTDDLGNAKWGYGTYEYIPAEPETTAPETTAPEATEPEATEPEATEPEATELEYVCGDANEDGHINVKDAYAIMDAINGLVELSEIGRVAADVNEDGKIDVLDANNIYIYKSLAVIDPESSIGKKEIILNIAKIPEVSVYTPEDDTDTDKPAEGIKVMDTVYNPEVGTTVTYRVNLTTEYNFDNIQASVFYDSTKLELQELRLNELRLNNNTLDNLHSYSDTEGKVRFCAASANGFDFSETADVLEIDFLVKDTDYSEIKLLMEEMWIDTVRAEEYYFSKCEANNTQHIEIVETLEFEKTSAEVNVKPSIAVVGTDSGIITEDDFLVATTFENVVIREKDLLAEVGAQVEADLGAKMTAATNVRLRGDANCDNQINIRDATTIQKYAASIIKINDSGFYYKNADVDADGKVNVKDATLIQKHLVGMAQIPTGPIQSA